MTARILLVLLFVSAVCGMRLHSSQHQALKQNSNTNYLLVIMDELTDVALADALEDAQQSFSTYLNVRNLQDFDFNIHNGNFTVIADIEPDAYANIAPDIVRNMSVFSKNAWFSSAARGPDIEKAMEKYSAFGFDTKMFTVDIQDSGILLLEEFYKLQNLAVRQV